MPVALFVFFLAAVFLRPLLPIDETRYMTVAWEMWLRGDWFAPLTVNFQLYEHKPPLLFWLINTSWSVFGVSRWAGLVPIFFASLAFIYLTRALAKKLFRTDELNFDHLPPLMLGSVPFLIYGSLVMFDITLAVFVLLALLALVSFAKSGKPAFLLGMALAMGLGVLAKGPVAWLYVIFPVLLAPYWLGDRHRWRSWYGWCALAFLLSAIPVLLWLVPVLRASNPDFGFNLIWEQTAGRVSGHLANSHARPIYFYLPLLPVLFLPWAFIPSFWWRSGNAKKTFSSSQGVRFIACWVIPVIISFSLISGKQPHYLVPLLPGVLIFVASRLQIPTKKLRLISLTMIVILIIGQAVASRTVFPKYDLAPIADYVGQHEGRDWVFTRKYQGELTFLGRLQKKLDDRDHGELKDWFSSHPQGMAVVRYTGEAEVAGLEPVLIIPYRGRYLGIFRNKP